ncbi:hypothetical protein EMCRGX_G025959 [Ephydatia muelleri]|eukprot:Em0021g677a
MEKKSSAAKTVAFSPLRQANAVFRNILDAPFRIKWPDVAVDKAALILEELKRSLTAVKRVRSHRKDVSLERPSKKPRLEVKAVPCRDASCSSRGDESSPIEEQPFDAGKCSQIVLGINAVTRHLEKGNLRAGVVCLSAKPAILQHHLLMLAATRDARLVALPALSETISPHLGVKSALAIGFKKPDGNEDYFQSVVQVISDVAPPIRIPWLCTEKNPEEEPSTEKTNQITAEARPASPSPIQPHATASPSAVRKREVSAPITTTEDTPGAGVRYLTMKVKRTFSKPKVNQK